MTGKKQSERKTHVAMGFGKGLTNLQKRRTEGKLSSEATHKRETVAFVPEQSAGRSRSVLEQSNIEDILATVEVRKEAWEDEYADIEEVGGGPVLIDVHEHLVDIEDAAAKNREMVSIPRRPKWREGMSVEELTELENVAFIEWRRGLKQLETDAGLVMTPYERNLDFWRQLWRCIERSDLLVQVLDARDPDFYFSQDLYRYVSELEGSKRLMVLVNKADYLTREQRQQWATYFQAKGVDAIFFSALNELHKQSKAEDAKSSQAQDSQCPVSEAVVEAACDAAPLATAEAVFGAKLDAVDVPVPDSDDDLAEDQAGVDAETSGVEESEDECLGPHSCLMEDDDEVADVAKLLDAVRVRLPKHQDIRTDARRGGYPSAEDETSDRQRLGVVGFVGYPNVGKSTVINALVGAKKVGMSRTPGKTKHIQTLQLPEWGFTLCDAPGLVLPSVVATRAHLVINNTVPLDDLRECWSPVRLIVEKIGFTEVLRRYNCTSYVKDAAARSGDHVLDDAHSFLAALADARHHFLRAGVPDENWAARKVLRDYCTGKLLHCEPPPGVLGASQLAQSAEAHQDAEDDFEDLDGLMEDNASTMNTMKMTKRKERHLLKQLSRGVAPAGFATSATAAGAGRRRENARAMALA